MITKFKLNESCQFTLCTPCASMNKLAYSLFLAFFQVPVNIYPHRDPMLSKQLTNVIWLDEWNHALLCKVLGIFFSKKIINSLSPQINEILPKTKLDVHAQTFISSLALLWVWSNYFTLVRDLSYSHDQDHVHVHSHANLLHYKIANFVIHLHKTPWHTMTLSL